MGKKADIYYKVHPFQIIEEGFEPEYAEVSESIFSIANEYMGVRGYFEEGYSGKRLIGSYFSAYDWHNGSMIALILLLIILVFTLITDRYTDEGTSRGGALL